MNQSIRRDRELLSLSLTEAGIVLDVCRDTLNALSEHRRSDRTESLEAALVVSCRMLDSLWYLVDMMDLHSEVADASGDDVYISIRDQVRSRLNSR